MNGLRQLRDVTGGHQVGWKSLTVGDDETASQQRGEEGQTGIEVQVQCQHGLIHRAGKSSTYMLLRGHHMTARCQTLCSCNTFYNVHWFNLFLLQRRHASWVDRIVGTCAPSGVATKKNSDRKQRCAVHNHSRTALRSFLRE